MSETASNVTSEPVSPPADSTQRVAAESLWHNALAPELRGSAETAEAYARYECQVTEQAQELPEVAERTDDILKAAERIITDYEIQPSLFEQPARGLVFTALASRWAKIGSIEDPEVAEQEERFLTSGLILLAHQHSPQFADAADHIHDPSEEANLTRAIEKYTHRQLSSELEAAIDAGLLDGVKARLGITPDNEDPYEVRVLSILNPRGGDSYGLAPSVSAAQTEAEKQADQEARQEILEYHKGLFDRAVDMSSEIGREISSEAWTYKRDGKTTALCITMPLAERLLYPELTAASEYYDDDAARRDLATLEHEYVHTQGGVGLDDQLSFGIGIEEFRAEHYSGNRNGYLDVKGFFHDVGVITGYDMAKVLESRAKSGTSLEVYADLAAHLGLSGMLEILLIPPNSYLDPDNGFQEAVHTAIGGYDGITQEQIDRERAKDGGKAMQRRIQKVANVLSDDTAFAKWAARRESLGLRLVPGIIKDERQESRLSV